jgi:Gas vesicle synthesis protein GvpO/Gas vesicle protein G
MFLLDSLLTAPGSAAFMLFKELARKAQEEWLDDDAVRQELQELYAMLESGRISEMDFEARECRLLERLEQIARAKFKDKWGTADDAQPGVEDHLPAPAPIALPPALMDAPPRLALPIATAAGPAADTSPAAPPRVAAEPVAGPIDAPAPAAPLVVIPESAAAPCPSAPAALAPLPAPGAPLTVFQVLDSATRAIAMLKLRVSAVTSVSRDEDGWKVTAELIERKGVPDTNDLLGIYDLRLDQAGNVQRYERTRMRRRGDLNRG